MNRLEFLSCLYGSELLMVGNMLFGGFLSCLYGSEQGTAIVTPTAIFLSCLYGSELEMT